MGAGRYFGAAGSMAGVVGTHGSHGTVLHGSSHFAFMPHLARLDGWHGSQSGTVLTSHFSSSHSSLRNFLTSRLRSRGLSHSMPQPESQQSQSFFLPHSLQPPPQRGRQKSSHLWPYT